MIDSGQAESTDTQVSELDGSSRTAEAGVVPVAAGVMLWLIACCRTLTRWASLVRQLLVPRPFPGCRAYLLRWTLIVPGLSLMAVVQLCNAAGLLLDDIVFRTYRQVRLRRPVFILGVPRSGTTHTHHLLSADQRFTTVTLWEALFAPSVTQRHVLTGLTRLDERLGGFAARLLRRLERRLQSSLEAVHSTGLRAPEEDFLLLVSSLDCFLLVLVFPESRWLWDLARGDDEDHRSQTRRVLQRYRKLLQRHVYFHGQHLQMLSKNASFAGLAQTLAEEFPGSAFIICERDAPMAVRSQLRSLADSRQLLQTDHACPDFESSLLDTLYFYYQNLDKLKQDLPAARCAVVPLASLSRQPRQVAQHLYEQLHLGSTQALNDALCALEAADCIRPATTEPARQTVAEEHNRFDRFHPWRHVPENRL